MCLKCNFLKLHRTNMHFMWKLSALDSCDDELIELGHNLMTCRLPLTAADLKPNTELKARIDQWKSRSKQRGEAMEQ